MNTYRDGMPPVPFRLRARPIVRGYPLPWFVCEVAPGEFDFRVVDGRKMKPAIEQRLCWLCGRKLGSFLAFSIGPMCAITRTISEPPSHRACAEWAMQACPFLTQRESGYRTSNLPDGVSAPAGIPITRQPGVACLWITKRFRPFRADDGLLFKIGDPVEVRWFRQGRVATRNEILASIDSGYPLLAELAEQDGPKAVQELEAAHERAMALLPPAEEAPCV